MKGMDENFLKVSLTHMLKEKKKKMEIIDQRGTI